MKIYLKNNDEWQLYDIERNNEELQKRKISIAKYVSIAEGVSIASVIYGS